MRKGRILIGCAILLCAIGPPAGCRSVREACRPDNVRVRWLGHNCFTVRSSLGLAVLTDPFDPDAVSHPKPRGLRADIVLISHESPLAANLGLLDNLPHTLRSATGVGANRAFGIPLRGVATRPDPAGARPGEINTVFCWTMGDLRFCHLGWIGAVPDPDTARAIGTVDVLFVPVGGPASLGDDGRTAILQALRPRVIIPMGYRTTRGPGPLDLRPIDSWLRRQRARAIRLAESEFVLSRDRLPIDPVILIPRAPRTGR